MSADANRGSTGFGLPPEMINEKRAEHTSIMAYLDDLLAAELPERLSTWVGESGVQRQSVSNVLKLAYWPLGFPPVAPARSEIFPLTQIYFNLVFVVLIWLGLSTFGLEVAGFAFLASYVLHFLILNQLVRRLHGCCWQGLSLKRLDLHMGLAMATLEFASIDVLTGGVATLVLGIVTGFVDGYILLSKIGPNGLAASIVRLYATLGWPIRTS